MNWEGEGDRGNGKTQQGLALSQPKTGLIHLS